jgi:lipopolysaccharide/colanic/teichoic acid biosynthesis glycosyltransferase
MTTNQALGAFTGLVRVDRGQTTDETDGPQMTVVTDDFHLGRALADRHGLARSVSTSRPTPRRYAVVKRAFDITVAGALLIITLPVSVALAAAIKLHDGGPVLFKQERTGRGGQRFKMLKFRSMCTNAEEMKQELRHLSTVAWPDFKLDHDPRITGIGRFMRATYLDEIPQLINVLRGEMSLVGPRPTSFAPSTYSVWHTERLDAVPGITGLWQVKRSDDESSFDERLRLDVHYIRNRSLRGDIRILLGTFTSSLRRSGK